MHKIQFDVYVAIGDAADFSNNVVPVWWMEIYPFRLNKSKSLLHVEIK